MKYEDFEKNYSLENYRCPLKIIYYSKGDLSDLECADILENAIKKRLSSNEIHYFKSFYIDNYTKNKKIIKLRKKMVYNAELLILKNFIHQIYLNTPSLFELITNYFFYRFNLKFIKRVGFEINNFSKVTVDKKFNLGGQKNMLSANINKSVLFKGIVKKVNNILSMVYIANYICRSCNKKEKLVQFYNSNSKPKFCNCKKNKQNYVLDEDTSYYKDVQKITVQIKNSETDFFDSNQYFISTAYLEDDLCSRYVPGDDVIIGGTLRQMEIESINKTPFYEKILEVNIYESKEYIKEIKSSISLEEIYEFKKISKNPAFFKNLINMVAPDIHGLTHIKKALTLQIFGGVSKILKNITIRGSIHVLLLGDPGTAKSQLLKSIKNLTNGVFASGTGSSSVGLTATVYKSKEKDNWSLEAGSFVLADKKILCIDEIDKFERNQIKSIHEPMEQQTVTINKANISASLNSRASVLASANPKFGKFNKFEPLECQITIPITLLSRFDLIFLLSDKREVKEDEELVNYILHTQENPEEIKEESMRIFFSDRKKLLKYIKYSKTIKPIRTNKANELIKNHYLKMRKIQKDNISITSRQLESIIRLSEAHAKTRLSKFVTSSDVNVAIEILNYTLYDTKNLKDKESLIDLNLIETGYSKSQKDIMNDILTSVKKLKTCSFLDLKNLYTDKLKEEKIRYYVQKLKNEGLIYEPSFNNYKSI